MPLVGRIIKLVVWHQNLMSNQFDFGLVRTLKIAIFQKVVKTIRTLSI